MHEEAELPAPTRSADVLTGCQWRRSGAGHCRTLHVAPGLCSGTAVGSGSTHVPCQCRDLNGHDPVPGQFNCSRPAQLGSVGCDGPGDGCPSPEPLCHAGCHGQLPRIFFAGQRLVASARCGTLPPQAPAPATVTEPQRAPAMRNLFLVLMLLIFGAVYAGTCIHHDRP